ncbi:MAG: metallophosphoesterase [Thermoplasmata archaeon]
MRILVISDLHGSDKGVRIIHSWIDETRPELLLLCGDITHFGPISFARDFLEELNVRTLAIPGNCDPIRILDLLDELGVNLHRKKVRIDGLTFVGFGGSNPTPFNTLFEIPEQEIWESLSALMERQALLVTHAPPYGILDVAHPAGNLGSRSVRKIVEDYRPRLSVFGHIHEARGLKKGETTFLNPGEARRGYGAFVSIEDSIEVKLLG